MKTHATPRRIGSAACLLVLTSSAQPSVLSGLVVEVGKSSPPERLIIQGEEPFGIVSATCDDPRFECTVQKRTETLSQVNVTFTAGKQVGKVSEVIRIATDLADTVLEVPVHVRIVL